jgi:GrpB-like predicted nucleotidyltransferase (UPF0157 family)
MGEVKVVAHDPTWSDAIDQEAALISEALGDNVLAIHHIGSTAIPGIYAKPVIDILVEVGDLAVLDDGNAEMEALNYEVMGEFGIPGRRYFRKDNFKGIRTHQIHAFQVGSPQIARHIAFRDYLIAHPDAARAYSELKARVAKETRTADEYMDGKDAFIREIDIRAGGQRSAW